MTTTNSDESLPVSHDRLTACQRSARFWATHLDAYADRMQKAADFWAILAGVLAAITATAIWPVLGDDPSTEAKVIVSIGALMSAVCALVPRVMNYGERAGAARELKSGYGAILGKLVDLLALDPVTADKYQADAKRAVTDFEAVKAKKDALRRVGNREELQAKQLKWPRRSKKLQVELTQTKNELTAKEDELTAAKTEVVRLAAVSKTQGHA